MTKLLVMKSDFTCTKSVLDIIPRPDASLAGQQDVVISAAVGNASWNRCPNHPDDVKTIQSALNEFPSVEGGPNPSLSVDGICGQKTCSAIAHFQRKWDLKNRWGSVDGIVDVVGPTIERLRKGGGHRKTPSGDFLVYIPQTMQVITAARTVLTAAKMHYQLGKAAGGGFPSVSLFREQAAKMVDRHFHVGHLYNPLSRVIDVDRMFLNMQTAIGYIPLGTIVAADEPPTSVEGSIMFTFMGGYNLRTGKHEWHGIPKSSIYMCPRSRTLSRDAFVYAMIHELAHYTGPVDNGVDDYAYFHKNKSLYERLSHWQAFRNADCYSQFAYEVIGKRDYRVDFNYVS